MTYTVVCKLWSGCCERWDGLTTEQADAIYEQCRNNQRMFAVSLIEKG